MDGECLVAGEEAVAAALGSVAEGIRADAGAFGEFRERGAVDRGELAVSVVDPGFGCYGSHEPQEHHSVSDLPIEADNQAIKALRYWAVGPVWDTAEGAAAVNSVSAYVATWLLICIVSFALTATAPGRRIEWGSRRQNDEGPPAGFRHLWGKSPTSQSTDPDCMAGCAPRTRWWLPCYP